MSTEQNDLTAALRSPDAADALRRIADALEALVPKAPGQPDFDAADAFVWHSEGARLQPVPHVSRVEIGLLRGIDRVRDILTDNTERFARGFPRTTCCYGAPGAWASPRW